MITIKQLTLEGFRSFKEKTTIKFPSQGAILIQGMDSINNTSSGSGKSSILIAIDFCLGIGSLPATELKNWDSEKLYAELALEADGIEYKIVRSPKLSFYIDNEKYEGKSTGAEEKIQELLGLPKDLVKTLVSRPQREGGRFINFTDSQKKDFLTQALQLEVLEEAGSILNSELNSVTNETKQLQGEIQFIESQSVSAKAELESLLRSKDNHSLPENSEEDYQQPLDSAKARLTQILNTNSSDLTKRLEDAKAHMQNIETATSKISELQFKNKNTEKLLSELKTQITFLMENQCPTCQREWKTDEQKNTLDQKKNQFMSLIKDKQTNEATIASLSPLFEQRDQARQAIDQILSDKNNRDQSIAAIQSEISKYEHLIRSAQQSKELLKKVKADAELRIKEKQSQIEKITSQITDKTNRIESLKKELEIIGTASEFVGKSGFLGAIFDEILADIESKTNDMVSSIPNISRFVVRLSSDSSTKSGSTRKKINMSIWKNGNQFAYKSLSGGQQAALELCMDLAVGEVLRLRSGSKLGWVSLDEAMDGLDVEPKLAVIEMIKNKISGQIFMIDHATEIKEGFSSIIEINYDGVSSYVQ